MKNPNAKIKSLSHETHDARLTIIILFSSLHHLHKSQLHFIMKTKPSYTFQYSLLTREVFIMVVCHSQIEEFLIRRIRLVTHLYSIISVITSPRFPRLRMELKEGKPKPTFRSGSQPYQNQRGLSQCHLVAKEMTRYNDLRLVMMLSILGFFCLKFLLDRNKSLELGLGF